MPTLDTHSRPESERPRRTIGHWIDGEVVDGGAGRTAEVYDPAVGTVAARVSLADAAMVDRAVAAAVAAFPAWRETPLSRRVPILSRLRYLVREHAEDLVDLVCAEHGKVRSDALAELQRGIEVLDVACSAPLLLKGEFSEQVAQDLDTYSLRQPLGVCAGITPFNFPTMVPLWMFPIAIVSGNTFVLKPSERDPSASLLLAELAASAGVPVGVLNVVQGDRVAVDALLDHPDVAAISFVGSTPIARHVYERGTRAGKRVQALGGAKNHMVVMPDANLDDAADALVSAAFGSTGQRCMAISAAIAVGPIADALVAKVGERMATLQVGPAIDAQAELGPVVTGAAQARVTALIERGVEEGATLVLDGRGIAINGYERGYFVGPTLFDDVRPGMAVYDEEIFGPVLVNVRVDSFEEAVALVNGSRYGNGAAIFTRSGVAARRFQREATAGMIGINVPIPVPVSYYSFGGWKESLFGDQHIYGPEGFRFYTRGKVVTSRWAALQDDGVTLSFPTHA
jgi:malonate-semialdehyde dehydrogenase (acetylating) / methylmalonate-semialdehyde dehydrogenase